jgi:very-short-patch-repair endonuclease/predicted transcriptional regulator of viral defense system
MYLHPDRGEGPIARVARRQFGVVTRAQLVALGATERQIGRWLASGRVHRVHAGIYAVGHAAPRREAKWLAAVLACGDGALLSHRSAATLWCIRDGEGPRPDVTVPYGSGRRHPKIAMHRGRLAPQDYARVRGIPVTSPARTLVDLAHELDPEELERAFREAQFLRRYDHAATKETLTRRPSRALRDLMERRAPTQSHREDDVLRICHRHRIPDPLTQQRLKAGRVDFLWPAERLVVEADSWQAHGTPDAFQRDRASTNALQLAGYTVLRFTSNDLKYQPAKVARQIEQALTRARTL